MIGLNSIAVDITLPALPEIGEATNSANSNLAQLTIGVFLLAAAFSALMVGPLSDAYGRRPALLWGLGIFVVGSVLAPLATNLEFLLAARFLQGLGVGATRLSHAVVRDRYEGNEMAEIISLSLMVFLILPVIAPGIGQGVLFVANWQAIFLTTAALGTILMVWVWIRLPETLDLARRRPLSLRGIFGGLGIVLGDKNAVGYGLASMFLLGALYGFINSAQQVYGITFKLGSLFPLGFGAGAIFQSIAAFVCSRTIRRLGAERVGITALIVFTALSAFLATASLIGALPFVAFFLIVAAIMSMFTWADATFGALTMKNLGQVAGTAASAFGALQAVGATVLGALIGQAYNGTAAPLTVGFFSMGALALVSVLWGRSRAKRPQIGYRA